MILIILCAIIGIMLSGYAFYLEKKIKEDPNYQAHCDINDRISCSRPIKSGYTNIFLIPNYVLGILFYSLIIALAILHFPLLLLLVALGGFAASCFFAYILFFKIKSFCIVCIGTYIVNIFILMLALSTYLRNI